MGAGVFRCARARFVQSAWFQIGHARSIALKALRKRSCDQAFSQPFSMAQTAKA